ncbi:paraquat-inducible protein A [Rhodoferax sp. WC2427]|uniref:paraquat-inducible protein A n=1 Tax=Rhodoferax sp. WC2427 TaxID=3234144 RepID=UPI0034674E7A
MQLVPHAILCEGCDAVYPRTRLQPGETARCSRCGTELERYQGDAHQRMLPLVLAGLLMFAVANLFPIVSIMIGGQSSDTTLVGAVAALTDEGMGGVATLVLATTLLFPLLQLLVLLYLLLPQPRQLRKNRPLGFAMLVRMLQMLQPWGMVEVFLLGVLVAIVKLTSSAEVIAGPALGAFVALTVLLTAILSFPPRNFWHLAFDAPPSRP